MTTILRGNIIHAPAFGTAYRLAAFRAASYSSLRERPVSAATCRTASFIRSPPGCCALISALALSGLPTGRFTFEGFLPVNRGERRERLRELAGEERTMIFYEAPHKLRGTLEDLYEAFGGRRAALCRELREII
mgnify:CR=1 FL=1